MRHARYLLVTGALALGACGGEDTLDASDIESEVVPQIEKQTGTRDVVVECPDDVEAEEGAVFECDVSAEGGVKAKLKVTQEDDQGNVRWEIVKP